MVPDGTVRDEYRLARGWWEAKDTGDKLATEIQKKLKAGYPTRNIIFEDTQTAVLYQDRAEAGEYAPCNCSDRDHSCYHYYKRRPLAVRVLHLLMLSGLLLIAPVWAKHWHERLELACAAPASERSR